MRNSEPSSAAPLVHGADMLSRAAPRVPCDAPYAAITIDYLGCEYLSRDVANIEKIAADGSNGPTEVIYLYDGHRVGQETLETYFARQIEWSRETFGPALRTRGVLDHITKELREINADPHDLSEWVDVIILAMDGFWRHGGKASDLFGALLAKQHKNMARTWPDWRTMSEDSAIEHDRSKDAAGGDA